MSTDISMNTVSNTQTTQTAEYNASLPAVNLMNQALRQFAVLFTEMLNLYAKQAETMNYLMYQKGLEAHEKQLQAIKKNTHSERVKAGWGLAGTGVAAGMGIAGATRLGGMQFEHAMPLSHLPSNAMSHAGAMHGASLSQQGQTLGAQAEAMRQGLETYNTAHKAQKDGVENMNQQIHALQRMMLDTGNQLINALRA